MATLSSNLTITPTTAANSGAELDQFTHNSSFALHTATTSGSGLAANTNIALSPAISGTVQHVFIGTTAVTNFTVSGNNIQFDTATAANTVISAFAWSEQALPQHYFTNNANAEQNSDNFNDASIDQGTYINPGVTLTLDSQASVSGGTMKIGANNTGAGGTLIIDGASLSLNRLATAGNIGGTLSFNSSSTPENRPSLIIRNGGILNMLGQNGQAWRGFLGNHSQARVLCTDGTINFSNDNVGRGGAGGTLSNGFLGVDSRFNNSRIIGMAKVELLGAILEFEDVTIEYTTNGDLSGNSGAMYSAGQPNIVSSLGSHTIIIPTTYTPYPNSGTGYFKYASLRNKSTGMTINGTVTIRQGTTSFNVRCHDFFFEPSTISDLTNFYILQNTLSLSATRVNSQGTNIGSGGNSNTRVALMDNRDLLQMSKTDADFTSGNLSPSTYTWYSMYKRAFANDRSFNRVLYGWPTGKAAAFRNAVDGTGNFYTTDSGGESRSATLIYHDDSIQNSQALTLDSNSLTGVNNDRLRADVRRFYPFRAGYHEWGNIPEYVNSGLGTEAFLGIDGNGVSGATLNKGNLIAAEASANDVRDGKSLVITTTQDDALLDTPDPVHDVVDDNLTVTNPAGSSGTLGYTINGGNVGLNTLHANFQKYIYDNITNDSATNNVTAITLSNLDGSGNIAAATAANAGVASDVMFFTETSPGTNTTSAAANTGWNLLNYVQFNSNLRLLSRAHGTGDAQEDNTLEGYLYFYRSSTNWAFYRYTRTYQEANSAVSNSSRARLYLIAYDGNVGADNSAVFVQRSGSIDGTSFQQTYPIRSYLWDSQVGLRPSEYIGNGVMRIRRASLTQTSTNAFVKSTATNILSSYEPLASLPGTALNSGTVTYTSNTPNGTQWQPQTFSTSNVGSAVVSSNLTSWDWSGNQPQFGFTVDGSLTSANVSALDTWSDGGADKYIFITDGGTNWGLYTTPDNQAVLGDTIQFRNLTLVNSSGTPPTGNVVIGFGSTESGANVNVIQPYVVPSPTGDLITTVDMALSSDRFNAGGNSLQVDISGSGRVTGLTLSSTSLAPAIIDGVTVGTGTSIEFARGSTYYIAGDISAATLVPTGSSGDVNLIRIGNGALPSTAPTNFLFQKQVAISFTGAPAVTWNVDNLATKSLINFQAHTSATLSGIYGLEPVSSFPSDAINEGSLTFSTTTPDAAGEWQPLAVSTDGSSTAAITTLPSSWDWTGTEINRPNAGLQVRGLTTAEMNRISNWVDEDFYNSQYCVITDGGENWAIFELQSPARTLLSNMELGEMLLVASRGSPQSTGMHIYFGVAEGGASVNIVQTSAETAPTPTLSNSNRTLTYTFNINTDQNLYYAFAARVSATEDWYNLVSGNTEQTDTPFHQLTVIPTANVPTAATSASTAQVTYINNNANDVVRHLHEVASASHGMTIEIDSTATAGTSGDGRYMHRLIQQKDNYLRNVAAGYYPVDGYAITQSEVQYTNQFVRWQKDVGDNNVVGFALPTVNTAGQSVNSAITTTNVQTLVSFNPSANIGVVASADLAVLDTINERTETIDTTTKATLGQVL